MSPRALRRIVVTVFVAGIAGMIVGSIRDSNGMAITFGIVTAVAALGLILVTSVAPAGSLAKARPSDAARLDDPREPAVVDERAARDVEARIQALVDAGADEEQVRLLVGRAVDLGRGTRADQTAGTAT